MTPQLSFKFHTDNTGEIEAVTLDIVDLKYICHLGLHKNTTIFKQILETLSEINNEEND